MIFDEKLMTRWAEEMNEAVLVLCYGQQFLLQEKLAVEKKS